MSLSPFSISSSERKIAPTKSTAKLKADGTENNNDRVDIGPTQIAFDEWDSLGLSVPHLPSMRAYRLKRIQQQLVERDLAGILLFDPLNIRYATDSTNMQLWVTHNHCRACFISADGYVILWDFASCAHLSAHLPLVNEFRTDASFFYFECGNRVDEHADRFANQINDVLRQHAGNNKRLAIDKIEIAGYKALSAKHIEIADGQEVMELARSIKGDDEIKAMRCAIAACEQGISIMHKGLKAGMTENDLWSILHAENIRRGGEWIETRILNSGPRTNPWYQESGPRIISDGELVSFDTDLIGVYGICVDISRSWICGGLKPNAEQKRLYQIAHEHVSYNTEILKPGRSFKELSQLAHRLPEEFRAQRYGIIYHGVGLCDEYPCIRYPEDVATYGYDGVLKTGMTLCVEAYVGAVGGQYGIKLENQVLITETGVENLSTYPFESDFLE